MRNLTLNILTGTDITTEKLEQNLLDAATKAVPDIFDMHIETLAADLFEHPDQIPQNVLDILDKTLDAGYDALKNICKEVEELGYTFNFGLDAVPYDLRKISEGELTERKNPTFYYDSYATKYKGKKQEIEIVVLKSGYATIFISTPTGGELPAVKTLNLKFSGYSLIRYNESIFHDIPAHVFLHLTANGFIIPSPKSSK